jgi:hypothetical protein
MQSCSNASFGPLPAAFLPDTAVAQKLNPTAQKYCLRQCGTNKCCDGATVTYDAFEVVQDNRANVSGMERDVTLITQGTAERMSKVWELSERWVGPKVIVLVVFNHSNRSSDWIAAAKEVRAIQMAAKEWPNTVTLLKVITHGETRDNYSRSLPNQKEEVASRSFGIPLTLYPINTLRNVGVDTAKTNWIFPIDLDFLPSSTLYPRLLSLYLPAASEVSRVGNICNVIPCLRSL